MLLKTLMARQSAGDSDCLLSRLEAIRQLQASLQQHLDPALAPHCRIANCNNGILTLASSSANWASRLRYRVPEMLKSLRTGPVHIKSIRVIVIPERPENPGPLQHRPYMSPTTAGILKQFADSVDDAELSASIRRLSRNSSVK